MFFAVSMFFHTSPVERPDEHFLWEDSIVLIEADSEEAAELKARALAKAGEIEYENAVGEMVTTKFECIASVFQIDDELKDGCEIFSRFLKDSEAKSLLTKFDD